MRISDWSSGVCSSDLAVGHAAAAAAAAVIAAGGDRFGGLVRAAAHRHLDDLRVLLRLGARRLVPEVLLHQAAAHEPARHPPGGQGEREIGRATGRERVEKYVKMSVMPGS